MAITNFIPTIWSENLYTRLDEQYIGVKHCNRDFEGEIKNLGSVVKICQLDKITAAPYTKNTDMSIPQNLSDTYTDLNIDQAEYFNFQIDDIDRAQCTPKLMDAAMRTAANALAKSADKYVYGLYEGAGTTIDVTSTAADEILDAIISARQKLFENNVLDTSSIVVEVSPAIASVLLKAKISTSSDNFQSLENGCIGSICGCKVFVSNNVVVENGMHKCFVRTNRAIAFAEQISEISAYRPEKRFADAVKGLHLYGAAVVVPEELVVLNIKTSA